MAVAVILAALLRRAEAGPDTTRPLARTASTRDMPNHLPKELATDIGRWPAELPEPAPQATLGAAPADDTNINPNHEIDAETVVPFGLLDILDDSEGRW
jgi:hypothetical protein